MADELLDIVNDEDIVIEQQMRSIVHQHGLQHRGVHVFLLTQDGKMLIQKRSADRAYPSIWDCSISEHVKAGESYLDAAHRGMKEEMGVDGIDIEPLVKFKMNYGINDNEISILYKGIIEPNKVNFDKEEIEEVSYYSIEELEEMITNIEKEFCGWFVEILNWYLKRPANLKILDL